MEFYTLASGSSGNATLIRQVDTSLLIDAGISARRITQALSQVGMCLTDLDGILITHEHVDHIRGLQTLCKKCTVPIYASRGTAQSLAFVGSALHIFDAGEQFTLGAFDIVTFPSSHDAADPVGYRLDCEDGSLGFLTDTGFVTNDAYDALLGVDALLLEANHDVDLLKNGPYPHYLKQRISGRHGHLSNVQAAEFALDSVRHGTHDIMLAHLSAENNTPVTAEYTVARKLQQHGYSVRLCTAPRDTVSEVHLCRKSPSFASEN